MSLLDDNFDVTSLEVLGDLCVRYYKSHFQLNCKVKFVGIGNIKLENILEHPERYAIASHGWIPNEAMNDEDASSNNEYIRICWIGSNQRHWYVYNKLKISTILKNGTDKFIK